MVGRVSNAGMIRVSVKVEVSLGEAPAALFKGGAVFEGIRKELELAVHGRGVRVPRPASGGNPFGRGCYGCGSVGHLEKFCPKGTRAWTRNGVAGRCWGCSALEH